MSTPRTTPRRTVLVDKPPKRRPTLGVLKMLDALGEDEHRRPLARAWKAGL